jgi:hypothetical protein
VSALALFAVCCFLSSVFCLLSLVFAYVIEHLDAARAGYGREVWYFCSTAGRCPTFIFGSVRSGVWFTRFRGIGRSGWGSFRWKSCGRSDQL